MRFRIVILLAVLLGVPNRAVAAPIGTFEWVYDTLFATGSSFNVTNESESSFEDIFVDLYAPEAADPFQSLSLNSVEAGGIVQSFEDLSFLVVPFDLDRAHLRFTFNSGLVGLDLFASALTGDPQSLMAASVDIFAPEVPPSPAPVPEPATLLLLGTGLGAMGLRRIRGRRDAGDGDGVMTQARRI